MLTVIPIVTSNKIIIEYTIMEIKKDLNYFTTKNITEPEKNNVGNKDQESYRAHKKQTAKLHKGISPYQ